MYKVLPYVLKLKRYSHVKKTHSFLANLLFYQVFGRHFSSHVMKSILSGAELCADQDGT